MKKLKQNFRIMTVDENEGSIWETVVDFTKINKKGVPISDVLRSLKKINNQDR